MTEITRCNRIGFHYNGFLNVLDNSNPAYNAKSSKKNLKKIIFAQTAELGLSVQCSTLIYTWIFYFLFNYVQGFV